ncbi:YhbY family RNA-binding protein [Candidatus Woesearchaeota archaeon]|nr:YhbY family RNA-binding protein [Candidatus Woesearchaeota archaeon]
MDKINNIKELKDKARLLNPAVRIGKSGITENLLKEIRFQLEQKKLIKIKLLSAALSQMEKKKTADLIAEETNANIVQIIGNCVILAKR